RRPPRGGRSRGATPTRPAVPHAPALLRHGARRDLLDGAPRAHVAGRVARIHLLVEVREDRLMATAAGLDHAEQLDGALVLRPAHLRILDLAQEALVQLHVGPRIEEGALARLAVAAGPAHLLIPRLHVLRHVTVDDEAHVGLVDAHAERDGRDHDGDPVLLERLLVPGTLLAGQPGMVGARLRPVRPKEVHGAVDRAATPAIADPPLAAVAPDEGEDLASGIALSLLPAADDEVGTEERALETGRLAHAELPEDVLRDRPRRGRGERQDRHRKPVLQVAQPTVGGSEIVSPLGDTMRLVHHHERDGAGRDELAEAAVQRL